MRTVGICLALLLTAVTHAWAQQPSQAQISAIKQSCRGDYSNVCAGVPTGGSAALQCLQQHAGSVSAGCQQALSVLGGAAPPSSAGASTPTPAPAPGPAPATPALSPREQAAVLRADCGRDYRYFCRGVEPGGGRAIACLRSHMPRLSRACQSALLSLRRAP